MMTSLCLLQSVVGMTCYHSVYLHFAFATYLVPNDRWLPWPFRQCTITITVEYIAKFLSCTYYGVQSKLNVYIQLVLYRKSRFRNKSEGHNCSDTTGLTGGI